MAKENKRKVKTKGISSLKYVSSNDNDDSDDDDDKNEELGQELTKLVIFKPRMMSCKRLIKILKCNLMLFG
jgi:hypothetical protein